MVACALGVSAFCGWGAHASTLDELKTRGELVWGADAQGGAPFVFVDAKDPDRLIGFEVDLARALAKELGVSARMKQGAWDRLLELMDRKDFDVALNGIEVSDDKAGLYLLSKPYYVAPERLTVRKGDARAPR